MSPMQIRNKRKADAFLKGVGKKQNRAQADLEIGEGAGLRLQKLEGRIADLEQEMKLLRAQTADVWAWWKNTQEGKEVSS